MKMIKLCDRFFGMQIIMMPSPVGLGHINKWGCSGGWMSQSYNCFVCK